MLDRLEVLEHHRRVWSRIWVLQALMQDAFEDGVSATAAVERGRALPEVGASPSTRWWWIGVCGDGQHSARVGTARP